MKRVKTSELSGAALDWAVAKCEGLRIDSLEGGKVWAWKPDALTAEGEVLWLWRPSANWAQGGPIIERERIYVYPHPDQATWLAVLKGAAFNAESATPLIAAMRCLVASKLGDEVDVPEKLS